MPLYTHYKLPSKVVVNTFLALFLFDFLKTLSFNQILWQNLHY